MEAIVEREEPVPARMEKRRPGSYTQTTIDYDGFGIVISSFLQPNGSVEEIK